MTGETKQLDQSTILERRLANMEQKFEASEAARVKAENESKAAQMETRFAAELKRRDDIVDQAEKQFADLHASGEADPAALARAQRTLSQAVADRTRVQADVESFRRAMDQRAKQAEAAGSGSEVDTTNLEQWTSRNPWYGKDTEMTAAAQERHQTLQMSGEIPVGSLKYFEEIDRHVRARFPDRFTQNPGESDDGGMPTLNSGQGEKTPAPSGSLRMTPSLQRAAQKFGMTPEQWAAGREQAVKKGFLPKDPVTGDIVV